MITLAKCSKPSDSLPYPERRKEYREMAERVVNSSGLRHAIKVTKDMTLSEGGYILIEDTPGYANFNPKHKLVKVVHYVNEPGMDRDYHAKYQLHDDGRLIEL